MKTEAERKGEFSELSFSYFLLTTKNGWLRTSSRGLLQGAFDEGQAALGLFAQQFFMLAAIPLNAPEFIRDRQSREHRNFLCVHGLRHIRNCLHLFIDVPGKLLHVRFIQLAANRVRLPEDLYFHRHTHVSGL